MEFPRINTKATNITITPKLKALLEQKCKPLGKLIDAKSETHCDVELEKTAEHHSGKIYRAEINFRMGGKLFRTEATEVQIEKAIDTARNELRKELQKEHGKRQSLKKRGGQVAKTLLRKAK